MSLFANLAALLACLGLFQGIIGWLVVVRFVRRPSVSTPASRPPVTILRPLCGAEPLLEEALVSCFGQAYPEFQIVFGIQDPADPALLVLERVKQRYPERDVAIVVDSTPHGANRKVANLINMLPSAKHDLLVISDSDIHAPPNFLERLVAAMEQPETGLVTSLYIGLPPNQGFWERLGATQITHSFLPGVLLSRAMGRQDCLGSTAMLRRDTLERIGGFRGLVTLLAEDNVLGQRVRELGLNIGLTDVVVAATVPEPSFRTLWLHETRWTCTIRLLAPYALAASALQYPLFWAMLAMALSGGATWSVAFFFFSWLVRAMVVGGINSALRPQSGALVRPTPFWIFPFRDALSVLEIGASYCIDEVIWRGHKMCAKEASTKVSAPVPSSTPGQ